MKPLLLLDPTKLTLPERLKLRQDGYDVPTVALTSVCHICGGSPVDASHEHLPVGCCPFGTNASRDYYRQGVGAFSLTR